MENKRILWLLGILLAILIAGLIVYAFSLNKIPLPTNPNINQNLPAASSSEEKTEDDQAKKLKEEFSSEKYNTRKMEIETEDNFKITKSAEGVIKTIGENSLVVDFNYGGHKWQSTVNIRGNTFILSPFISPTSTGDQISLTDLKIGDKITVHSSAAIANVASFDASIIRTK